MNTANTLLREDANMLEFMRILKTARMQGTLTEVSLLLSYIDTMEKQFSLVYGELTEIKGKLNAFEERQSPIKSAYKGMVKGFEAEISKTRETFSNVKGNLIEGVKKAVSDFKRDGTLALDKAISFLGVKKDLINLKENIGRALSGKEKLGAAPNGKLNKALRMPFHAIKDILAGIEKLTGKAIGGISRLEQLAEAAHETKPKTPVRQSVEKIKGDAPDKPDKRGAKNNER